MSRTFPFLLGLGVMSCAVRIESTHGPPASPSPVAANVAPATPRPALRARPFNRLARRPVGHPSAPSTPSSVPSTSHGDASVAQLCVDEINRYRASVGQRPLARASDREACADGQIKDDASSGHWHGKFGACGEGAQNECMSSKAPRDEMIKGCLKGMWNEGPGGGHHDNMKSATATSVWCGFHTAPNGDVWSVQDFR